MNLFKDIAQTLGIALGIGLIVFCLVVIFDRNANNINWNSRRDRIDTEAERVSENVDKYVRRGKKIYTKLKEMETDDNAPAKPGTTTTTTPPPTSTVAAKPTPPPPTATRPIQTTTATVSTTMTADQQGPFVIQVGRLSSKTPTIEAFSGIKKFGTIYVSPSGTDKKVVLGTFTDRTKAESALSQIRSLGYVDAFLSKETPKAGNSQLLAMSDKSNTAANTSNIKPASAGTGTTTKANDGFVVQVVANKFPVLSTYKSLSSLGKLYQEQDAATQLSKIMLGTYQDEETARQILQTVKKNGFENAFIKKVEGKTINSWKKL